MTATAGLGRPVQRVLLPLESVGRRERVDQLAAARWALETAQAEHARLVVVCPLRPPVSFAVLPDPGPLVTLRKDAETLALHVLRLVTPTLRAGVRITVHAAVGDLTALLAYLLTDGDALVLPPPDPSGGRWCGSGRLERRVARLVADAGAVVTRAGYACRPVQETS